VACIFTILFKGLSPSNILIIYRSQSKLHDMRCVPDMNFQENPSNGVQGTDEEVYCCNGQSRYRHSWPKTNKLASFVTKVGSAETMNF